MVTLTGDPLPLIPEAWQQRLRKVKPPPRAKPVGAMRVNVPWVNTGIDGTLSELAATPESGGRFGGRNKALNSLALRSARLLLNAEPNPGSQREMLREKLIDACHDNGLLADDGHHTVNGTIDSAFGKADHDGAAPMPAPKSKAHSMTDTTTANADIASDGEVIDGATLLHDIEKFLARFIAYPSEEARIAHTLWIAHTWLMDCWESTPRIAFLSPEPGSGKTRALEVSEPLVPCPIHSVNVTSAYLFRKIAEVRPTLLYDEIDTVFGPKAKESEDIRAVINSGHRNGAVSGRCVVRGKRIDTEELPSYCAVAMAGLNDLPDTVMDRCVVVRMRRRAPDELVQPWRRSVNESEGMALGYRLAKWARGVAPRASHYRPVMPKGVADRSADVWEALLAVAELCGADWPERGRSSAVALVAEFRKYGAGIGTELLRDLRTAFAKRENVALTSAEVLTELRGIEEGPWRTYGRRENGLDARALARLLRGYGIQSKNMRVMTQVLKGYDPGQFADAWKRYLTEDDSPP